VRGVSCDPQGKGKQMPIQALDIILVAIMIFSGLLAMLRGLTREMLSIMSWALAALVTLLAYSNFKLQVRSIIDTPMLADATLIAVVFLTSLIVFSLLTANISERVLDSRVGAIDRTLGFVYGLLRGLILVVIAYLIVAQIVERPNMPKWVTQARSLYLIESTGDTIKSFVPDNPDWLFNKREPQPSSPAG
jgi:membrane protein required for colicin V production